MRAGRLLTPILGAAALLATVSPPATAGEANGASDTSGISAGATDGADQASTGPGTGTSGPRPTCTPPGGEPGPVNWRRVPDQYLTADQREQVDADGGAWYWRYCGDQPDAKPTGTDNGAVWFADASGGPAADPGALAAQALQHTPLPEPAIRMNPQPPVPLLVGLETYLWVDPAGWQTQTASATAGSVTSTVTAVPERVVWDMGQGDMVVCEGPGRPYAPGTGTVAAPPGTGACTFTYPHSSARSTSPDRTFTVTATVFWRATWTASGAAGGGELGTVERTSSVAVQVAELQALNANPRANS